jgi:hypothetical protein
MPGNLPSYEPLDPQAQASAVQAGLGRTLPQASTTGDPAGHERAEPVNFIVHGSREALTRSLTSQGWVQAGKRSVWNYVRQGFSALFFAGKDTAGPVSEQYLNGKGEDMAFNKNSDYNLARDHMRVFYQGKDAQGQDVWAIACSRDTAVSLELPHPQHTGRWPWQLNFQAPSIGHDTDKALDGERNQIMADMLASGQVKHWASVAGVRDAGAPEQRLPDGTYQLGPYTTDGRVFEVNLG